MLNRRRGYTLIEILVVITIGVILGTVGMVKYRDAQRRQAVDAAAQKLISAFRKAQTNSAAGVKDACGSLILKGWRVDVGVNNYVINVVCEGGTYVYRTENYSDSTAISVTSGTVSILFKVLNQGTDIAGSTTIGLTGFGTTRNIVISSTGEIL